jgi:hypothetical protein
MFLRYFINFLGNILHGKIFGRVSSSQQILYNSSGTAVAMRSSIVISCNITSHLATHEKALKLPLYIMPTQLMNNVRDKVKYIAKFTKLVNYRARN